MGRERFDVKTFLISLVAAVIWSVAGNFLYGFLEGKIWGPLLTSLFFAGLILSMYVSILITNRIRKGSKYTGESSPKTLLTIAGIIVCAMLLDFLYGLDTNVRVFSEPTGYAFLIDDSGSMASNDFDNVRVGAIGQVMEDQDKDFPYVVYKFTNTAERLTDVLKASEAGEQSYDFQSNGNTDILNAVCTAAEDIRNGTVDLGERPRIILLSDGGSFYPGVYQQLDELLPLLEERGISACTVGFGESYDELLQTIADSANGVFVRAEEAADLNDAMKQASTAESAYHRNLLAVRARGAKNGLYMALRIVFLMILGGLFILVRAFAVYTRDDNNKAFIICLILVAVGALAVELGMNALHLNESLMRTIMSICFSVLIGSESVANGNGSAQVAGNGYLGGEGMKF